MQVSHVPKIAGLLTLLFAIGALGAAPPAVAQEPPLVFRLVKADTRIDHPDEQGADWLRFNLSVPQADGSVIVTALPPTDFRGSTWQVWPNEGRSTFKVALRPGGPPAGTVDVTWTVPPPTWSSDQDVTFALTSVVTNGDVWWTGGELWEYPVERFQPWTIVGENPWDFLQVATQKGGASVDKVRASGSITLRPKGGKAGPERAFRLGVSLYVGGKDAPQTFVDYHYESIPPGQEPPSQPTAAAPQPTTAAPQPTPAAPQPTTAASQPTPAAPQPPTGGVPGTPLPLPPFGNPEPDPTAQRMTLQAAQRRVVANDLVLIPVWLINGDNVANINFDLAYTASVARPEGTIQKGNLLDNALFSVNPNVSGIIRAGFAQTSGVNGTGTVMYVPFRAVGKTGDRTRLDLTVTTINNPSGAVLTIDRIPGEIVIVGAGDIVLGDCNGDGRLSAVDAECALDMSVGLRTPNLVMDLDKSGAVTSRDAVLILQGIVSIIR